MKSQNSKILILPKSSISTYISQLLQFRVYHKKHVVWNHEHIFDDKKFCIFSLLCKFFKYILVSIRKVTVFPALCTGSITIEWRVQPRTNLCSYTSTSTNFQAFFFTSIATTNLFFEQVESKCFPVPAPPVINILTCSQETTYLFLNIACNKIEMISFTHIHISFKSSNLWSLSLRSTSSISL